MWPLQKVEDDHGMMMMTTIMMTMNHDSECWRYYQMMMMMTTTEMVLSEDLVQTVLNLFRRVLSFRSFFFIASFRSYERIKRTLFAFVFFTLEKISKILFDPLCFASVLSVFQLPNTEEQNTMKVVALISGGKDSFYNMVKCVEYGHEIVCLANLLPASSDIRTLFLSFRRYKYFIIYIYIL